MMDCFDRKGLKPMLLTETRTPMEDRDYISELKLDGIRCLAYLDGTADLRNKRDIALIALFPELKEICGQAKGRCILDGELIITGSDGRPDFECMQARAMMTDRLRIALAADRNPATFVAFDILYFNGQALNARALEERKSILRDTVTDCERLAVSRVFEDGAGLLELTRSQTLEGIVQKRRGSLYRFGKRSRDWVKVKNLIDEDFVACGYIPKGNLCSLVLGQYEQGQLMYQGHVTLGVSREAAKRYPAKGECPFDELPAGNERACWYAPLRVCTVRYMERTSGGAMRQPRLKGFREDKRPGECKRDGRQE
jgi:bifunctional non-homologous end joining protein LigD